MRRTVQLVTHVDVTTKRELERLRRREGVTFRAAVQRALDAYLARHIRRAPETGVIRRLETKGGAR